ncbi:MAG: A24 family peptidase [Terriglobia bacterium]
MTGAVAKDISVSVLTLGLALWAGWLDWRSHRIPNWLTVPGLLAGLAASTLAWGWPGTKGSLEGAGLALAILLPTVLLRGLGAGDWKLMGALGAFLGPQKLIVVLLGAVSIAGLMAIIAMIQQKRVKQTLRNVLILVHSFITFRILPRTQHLTLDNPDLMRLPFGVAAAAATLLFFSTVAMYRFF